MSLSARRLPPSASAPDHDTRPIGGLVRVCRHLVPVLVALACAACLTASARAAATTSVFRATSAVNGWTVSQLPAAQMNVQLAAMQTSGVRVVRADAPWVNIEPGPPGPSGHKWQLAQTDAWVKALALHHLTWEPIVDFSVWWAKTCPGFCAPTVNTYYAEFAQELAARYGAHGSFWAQNPSAPYYPAQTFEIWNEENVQTYWMPAARYASLYLAAHDAIHAVDPTASVIVGGLADDSQAFNANTDYPAWYVQQMFAADPAIRGHIDGFGLHPYGNSAVAVERWVAHFRSVLVSVGEGSVPIDITELGWPTGNSSFETWRASMMGKLALDLSRSNCGVGLLSPYDWINPNDSDANSDFGLVKDNGNLFVLRKTGTAWFDGLAEATQQPELTLCGSSSPGTLVSGRGTLAHIAGVSSVISGGGHGARGHQTLWSVVKETPYGARYTSVRHRSRRRS
jgi:hypothetical protein